MQIYLKNIGIVKESKIELSGLTVITGKNNSGKTTVGKSLYSLIDATSNLDAKARADKNYYVNEKLDDVCETLTFFRYARSIYKQEITDWLKNYPALIRLINRDYRWSNGATEYAQDLCLELQSFDVQVINPTALEHYVYPRTSNSDSLSVQEVLKEQINKAVSILEKIRNDVSKDPENIDYARESINQTLNTEFFTQIQPVAGCQETSIIEIIEDNAVSTRVEIEDNRVVNTGNPVYYGSQYKRVFFVDDPFVLDGISTTPRIRYNYISEAEYSSLINPNRIVLHSTKLMRALHARTTQTVLEHTIANESINHVKELMDCVLPGSFDFSSNGDFYIHNGNKLSVSNLATGSKMFSIVKLLLEKGALDRATILILDEPEAHLHPMWQNSFAEIIVLLVKELGVNVLLTTHSPNFMLALDAYMRKYQLQDKVNFYQTNSVSEGFVEYCNVNENISSIYSDFLQYLAEVKVLRNKYLMDGEDSE